MKMYRTAIHTTEKVKKNEKGAIQRRKIINDRSLEKKYSKNDNNNKRLLTAWEM